MHSPQKLIWITWQLDKMNATVNKITHCSLSVRSAHLQDQILPFQTFEGEVPSLSMYLNFAATVERMYLYVHVVLKIIG